MYILEYMLRAGSYHPAYYNVSYLTFFSNDFGDPKATIFGNKYTVPCLLDLINASIPCN